MPPEPSSSTSRYRPPNTIPAITPTYCPGQADAHLAGLDRYLAVTQYGVAPVRRDSQRTAGMMTSGEFGRFAQQHGTLAVIDAEQGGQFELSARFWPPSEPG